MAHQHDTHADADQVPVHLVPMKVLIGVWLALIVLTWVTVAASWIDFGHLVGEPWLNIVGALGIALVKAALVALYFMHLRYDHPLHGTVLVAALAFVCLLIGIALLDAKTYDPDKIPDFAPRIEQMAAPADGEMPPSP